MKWIIVIIIVSLILAGLVSLSGKKLVKWINRVFSSSTSSASGIPSWFKDAAKWFWAKLSETPHVLLYLFIWIVANLLVYYFLNGYWYQWKLVYPALFWLVQICAPFLIALLAFHGKTAPSGTGTSRSGSSAGGGATGRTVEKLFGAIIFTAVACIVVWFFVDRWQDFVQVTGYGKARLLSEVSAAEEYTKVLQPNEILTVDSQGLPITVDPINPTNATYIAWADNRTPVQVTGSKDNLGPLRFLSVKNTTTNSITFKVVKWR